MRYLPVVLSAMMLLGLSGPARADFDYDDYKDMVHDRNEAYRKAVKRQRKQAYKAYRNGYGVRVMPSYYGSYFNSPYYGNHYNTNSYYRRHNSGLIGGLLDAIF
jgi:CRISPR/Cas system-associated protein Csx1